MKSRTLMEVVQSPGRKAFQQSPASACFRGAAVAFMLALPVVLVNLTPAIDPEPPQFRVRNNPKSCSVHSRCFDLCQVKQPTSPKRGRPPAIGAPDTIAFQCSRSVDVGLASGWHR